MEKNKNCIFCSLINGDIPAEFIYEDDMFVAFFDKFPGGFGHVLVVPKAHVENLFELTDDIMEKIMKVVQKVGLSLKEALNVESLNLVQNNGIIAGQSVNHFHIHLIPRVENDSINIHWETQTFDDDQYKNLTKKMTEIINR